MPEVKVLPYMPPKRKKRKVKHGKHKSGISVSYVAQLEHKAKLVELCRANGVPDCKVTAKAWKMRKYLLQRGIRTD